MTEVDATFLRRAIELAAKAREEGNPPFGSLLVGPDGEILLEERNTTITDSDITAHPELKSARWAGRELDAQRAAATTMYTSCQPCEMCAGAITRSFLGRVVYALSSDQLSGLKPGAPAPGAELIGPALYPEASAVVEGYYT